MYEETEYCVHTSTGDTRWFKITSVIKRGCVLSPLLIIIVIDFILRNSNSKGLRLSNLKQLSYVGFADDLTLLDEDKASLQEFFNRITDRSEKAGLHVNAKKKKCMAVCSDQPLEILHKGERVEQVSCFQYLGSIVEERDNMAKV